MSAAEASSVPGASADVMIARLGHVPLRLSADLPLPSMSMRDLRKLKPGQVLSSEWSVADDLLLTLGGAAVCWARFAAADGHMVLRVVRLV